MDCLVRQRSITHRRGTEGAEKNRNDSFRANPDALIVRENVARYAASGKLDASYLTTLSADATRELVAALPALDNQSHAEIAGALQRQRMALAEAQAAEGWPSWHLGRARALAALDRADEMNILGRRDGCATLVIPDS